MEEAAPHLVLDGAPNPGAVRAFAESVRALDGKESCVIVFSAVADKKYEQMIECLCRNVDARAYVTVEVEDARRVPAEELAQIFRKYTDKPVVWKKDTKEALNAAEALRDGEGDIYCLGSLYLAGMIKKCLNSD